MDRFEFCNLMEQAKVSSNITPSEISFSMRMLLPTLRRFEKGKHNFSMTTVMEYLQVLHTKMTIYNSSFKNDIFNYEQLVLWVVSERKKSFSQQTLAKAIEISRAMLTRVETQKSNLTIDVFLKIINILGYSVEITKY